MEMRVNNNWLKKVLFVFCLSLISGYGFADIASTGYVDEVIASLEIAEPQVNSDWNATGGVAQILNKPTIPTITDTYSATSSDGMSGKAVASAVANAIDANVSKIRSGSSTSTTFTNIWLE